MGTSRRDRTVDSHGFNGLDDIHKLFPQSYEESRARFREMLPTLKKKWPDAILYQHPLKDFPEITIDWIASDSNLSTEKMLLFTTGEHGIEGFVGSAVLEYFYRNYIPRLDQNTTGITLVHTINPWGMKFWRRTNPKNVDLNRNFVWNKKQIDPTFNSDYETLNKFLNPPHPVNNFWWEELVLLVNYLGNLATMGKAALWKTKILGQYAYPQGIHYGGDQFQEEVEVAKKIYRNAFKTSKKLLHLDMHTGYGPRYQMTLVNSPFEPKSSADFVQQTGYPLVAAMNPEEFYEVRGDMIDYVYMLRDKEFPEVDLYATSFEFGTFGISHWGKLRSKLAMILENQWYWHGASTKKVEAQVRNEFLESFSPSAEKWRKKAIADADQAIKGILEMEGFI